MRAGIGVFIAMALGLASRQLPVGLSLWDKSFGDVIYAVMIGLLVLVVKPSLASWKVGAWAFGICFALELFQATGIPARLPRVLRFVLGSTFAWHDVACYVAGALVIAGLSALEWRSRERA